MPTARVLPAPQTQPLRLPIRLRHLLMGGLAVLVVWQGVPRAKAAWRLQTLATSFADYALCMAGPTGPTLLRDNAPEFWRTARRRLVTSPADARPFQPCAALAEEITSSVDVRRAHDARARDFVEYGADAADRALAGRRGELDLSRLEVSTAPLSALARDARPFLREGYTVLVKPSLSAKEATHPSELPLPAVGQGLPASRVLFRATTVVDAQHHLLAFGSGNKLGAYQTRDGGVNWQPLSVRDPRIEAIGGRCFGDDPQHSFSLGLDDSRRFLKVASLRLGSVQQHSDLPQGLTQVIAMDCDEHALVVALSRAADAASRDAPVQLFVCAHGGACRSMAAPPWGQGLALRQPLDVTRLAGATVVAMGRHGLVRTASSRDDGVSWTPFIVAFDREAHSELRVHVSEPTRLLSVGKRVLLYGGAPKPTMTYPVLVSDDLGASWRRPDAS